jgi:alkylmercury lyase
MPNQQLPKYDLQELLDPLLAMIREAPDLFARLMKLQRLLLEGQPVSLDRIAAALHVAREEVPDLIRGAEFDSEGNVTGWGLSLVPTPHSYQINGRQFYVWCAADAITFPLLHKTSAVIASPDAISGETVRLIGTPYGARDVHPSTAVVSWVRSPSGKQTLENVRAAFCNLTNFFASIATASQYVAKHPGLVIVPIDDVFQMGKLLWEGDLYQSLTADL